MAEIDDAVLSPADRWARRYPHVTAEVLQQLEEEELTIGRIAARLGVSRSTLDRLRKHYGRLADRRSARPRQEKAPMPEPGSALSPLPATELKGEVLSTLPLAPFELHQRGRFNAVRLARRLAGVVALFECQEAEGEFELELVIRQVESEAEEETAETVRIESVVGPLTGPQVADLVAKVIGEQLRELRPGVERAAPADAADEGLSPPGPPEGGDDAP